MIYKLNELNVDCLLMMEPALIADIDLDESKRVFAFKLGTDCFLASAFCKAAAVVERPAFFAALAFAAAAFGDFVDGIVV